MTKYGGLIKFHGLENFWTNLSEEERNKIRDHEGTDSWTGPGNRDIVDSLKHEDVWSTETASQSLWRWGKGAFNDGNYIFAEKLFLEAEKTADNPEDKYFASTDLANLYKYLDKK